MNIYNDEYTGPRFSYGLRNRPLSLGAQPKGWIIDSLRPGDGTRDTRHGIVDYPHELTENEVSAYELVPMHKDDDHEHTQELLRRASSLLDAMLNMPEMSPETKNAWKQSASDLRREIQELKS